MWICQNKTLGSENMIGIYLSGTGNTKHCIEKLVGLIDNSAKVFPLEMPNLIDEIKKNDTIILGYPTQYSNAPYMVRDFIKQNSSLWKDKKIFCVATMSAFSGDGAGCTARDVYKRQSMCRDTFGIRCGADFSKGYFSIEKNFRKFILHVILMTWRIFLWN